jgi:hypothetical protein
MTSRARLKLKIKMKIKGRSLHRILRDAWGG